MRKIGLLKYEKWWSYKLKFDLRHACIFSELGLYQKRMNFVSVHNLYLIWFWILAFITFSEPAVRTWSLFDQLSKSKLTFSSAIKPSTVNLELFFYSEAQGLALISTVWVCRRVKLYWSQRSYTQFRTIYENETWRIQNISSYLNINAPGESESNSWSNSKSQNIWRRSDES